MQTSSTPAPALTILRIDASARQTGSVTRELADRLIEGLAARHGDLDVLRRDLVEGVAWIDPAWVDANFTDPGDRDAEQQKVLAASDALVDEAVAADIWVIGAPIYNFGVPASLKAWFDQIARARLTFRYTENGPEGLLGGKRVYILSASGGTEVGGVLDFATPWLKHMLGFLGVDDVTVIAADRGMQRGESARAEAAAEVEALLARDWPARQAA